MYNDTYHKIFSKGTISELLFKECVEDNPQLYGTISTEMI